MHSTFEAAPASKDASGRNGDSNSTIASLPTCNCRRLRHHSPRRTDGVVSTLSVSAIVRIETEVGFFLNCSTQNPIWQQSDTSVRQFMAHVDLFGAIRGNCSETVKVENTVNCRDSSPESPGPDVNLRQVGRLRTIATMNARRCVDANCQRLSCSV